MIRVGFKKHRWDVKRSIAVWAHLIGCRLACNMYIHTRTSVLCNDCQICIYIYIYTHEQVWGMGNGTSNMLAKVIYKYNLIFEVGF